MFAAIDEGLATAIWCDRSTGARADARIPDDIHFVAVVTMGYPTAGDAFTEGATSGFKQRRKPREEVVRWERWDGRATRA